MITTQDTQLLTYQQAIHVKYNVRYCTKTLSFHSFFHVCNLCKQIRINRTLEGDGKYRNGPNYRCYAMTLAFITCGSSPIMTLSQLSKQPERPYSVAVSYLSSPSSCKQWSLVGPISQSRLASYTLGISGNMPL